MINMIIKMALITLAFVSFSIMIYMFVGSDKLPKRKKIIIGIIYGIFSILSTHFGVDYGHMMLNVRDLGPLIAGLFFDPLSGVIAGLIGGIERYIAGTYFGVGAYTTIACSISTCLAGFLTVFLNKVVLKGKRPNVANALFLGAVIEVFHMYVVIITHRSDMRMAFRVVNICSRPMIIFTALGMALTAVVYSLYIDGYKGPSSKKVREKLSIADIFQNVLLIVMVLMMGVSSLVDYMVQTQSTYQYVESVLDQSVSNLTMYYNNRDLILDDIAIGSEGSYLIYSNSGKISFGLHKGQTLASRDMKYMRDYIDKGYFETHLFGKDVICKASKLFDGKILLVMASAEEMFWYRNAQTYESAFSAILIFTFVYFFIAFMVRHYVVDNLDKVNASLEKITDGDLNEVVDVRSSSEFNSLSNDINETVTALKGYIDEAKKRIEKELELAKAIQLSALPTNFSFKDRDEFVIYAMMDAAKEVGGDFYDFFFADIHTLAFAVADVSGKGIPGAMFMMRAKTTIRSFAANSTSPGETLTRTNEVLCEGNSEDMFVTAWLGFLDLKTGVLRAANFGHEYPIIKKADGQYEIYEDTRSMPLAAFEGTKAKEYELKLGLGDRVFLYTDGVPEAINKADEQYGMDRLINVLNASQNDSIKNRLKRVREDVAEFANGAEQFDDITLLEVSLEKYFKM